MSHLIFTRQPNLIHNFPSNNYSSTGFHVYQHSTRAHMVLTRSQQANQNASGNGNGNGQRTDKDMKPTTNGTNRNGHESRNHHLHPSLQHTTKTGQATPPESTAHHHPSFQPYCKHSAEDGDLHSHALGMSLCNLVMGRMLIPDLMALASGGQMNVESKEEVVPASVPNQSYLSAGRPPVPTIAIGNSNGNSNGNGSGSAPKSRRMSSSTSQARGKSAAIGTWESYVALFCSLKNEQG